MDLPSQSERDYEFVRLATEGNEDIITKITEFNPGQEAIQYAIINTALMGYDHLNIWLFNYHNGVYKESKESPYLIGSAARYSFNNLIRNVSAIIGTTGNLILLKYYWDTIQYDDQDYLVKRAAKNNHINIILHMYHLGKDHRRIFEESSKSNPELLKYYIKDINLDMMINSFIHPSMISSLLDISKDIDVWKVVIPRILTLKPIEQSYTVLKQSQGDELSISEQRRHNIYYTVGVIIEEAVNSQNYGIVDFTLKEISKVVPDFKDVVDLPYMVPPFHLVVSLSHFDIADLLLEYKFPPLFRIVDTVEGNKALSIPLIDYDSLLYAYEKKSVVVVNNDKNESSLFEDLGLRLLIDIARDRVDIAMFDFLERLNPDKTTIYTFPESFSEISDCKLVPFLDYLYNKGNLLPYHQIENEIKSESVEGRLYGTSLQSDGNGNPYLWLMGKALLNNQKGTARWLISKGVPPKNEDNILRFYDHNISENVVLVRELLRIYGSEALRPTSHYYKRFFK